MVNKKKRRSVLARAAAQRQRERRANRAERNRRIKIGAWTGAAVLAIAGLTSWIVTHQTAPAVTPVGNPLSNLGLLTSAPSTTYSPAALPSSAGSSPSSSPATTSTQKPTAKESK